MLYVMKPGDTASAAHSCKEPRAMDAPALKPYRPSSEDASHRHGLAQGRQEKQALSPAAAAGCRDCASPSRTGEAAVVTHTVAGREYRGSRPRSSDCVCAREKEKLPAGHESSRTRPRAPSAPADRLMLRFGLTLMRVCARSMVSLAHSSSRRKTDAQIRGQGQAANNTVAGWLPLPGKNVSE